MSMGEEIHVDFNTGSGGGSGAGGSSGGVGGPPPRVSGGASGADFDYRQLVPSLIQTAREVLLNPVNFYRSIRRQGDLVGPLLFAIICALVNAVLAGIIGFLFSVGTGSGIGSSLGGLIGTIFLITIGTAIGLFVWAAIYHLLVLLIIRPSHGGYEATFRVVAYAAALQLVAWLSAIPILGILVGIVLGVYSIVLSVIGIREMHSTTTGRAVAVVLIPAAIILILVAIIGVAIFAIIAAALSAGQ